MKNYLTGLMAVSILTAALAASPAMAQDTSGTGRNNEGAPTTTSTNNNERNDDNSKWGWLGLLGLTGLAGLRRPQQTVVRQDKDGGARAH